MKSKLNVLIACEESQAECEAFRQLGHNAFSCDIQPCRPGGHPEWHIHNDVKPYLAGACIFETQDGKLHVVPGWDLIIAHPPCTYLSKVGCPLMVVDGVLQPERYEKMKQARRFFMCCLNANVPYVAVENPIPMKRAELPRPSCYIQPYWYGVKYSKKTLYWLKNLPPLLPTVENPVYKEFHRASRGKYRSRTFPQVAQAIARQWSDYILSQHS